MKSVTYTPKRKAIVEKYDSLPPEEKSGDYWNHDEVSPVRAEIKDHYISEQRNKCAYCNQVLATVHHGVWDAEHIISKKLNPKFLFEPRNLAISCKDCNTAKGEQEVRKNPQRASFPDQSEHYLIVHPHFDQYGEHIRWFGSICAPNNSDKGQNTIMMCNLMRYSARILGIKGKIIDPDFDALIGNLINAPNATAAEAALAGIAVYVKKIPQDTT